MRNATLILIVIVTASCLIVAQEAADAAVRTQYAQRYEVTFDDGSILKEATFGPGVGQTFINGPDLDDFQVDSFFDVFFKLADDGLPGGLYTIDSFFDVYTEVEIPEPGVLSDSAAPTQVLVTERAGEEGTFDTEIISMSLTGNVPTTGGPVEVTLREDPTASSTGTTKITDIGGGLYHIDSFFDITYQIEFGGGEPSTSQLAEPGNTHAGRRHDVFNGTLTETGVAGGGSGWDGSDPDTEGDWIRYDQPPVDPQNPWYNQWFYNDPLDPERRKDIFYKITLDPADGADFGDTVEVALNWSDQGYSDPAAPPMSDQEEFIGRFSLGEFVIPTGGMDITNTDGEPFTLPFNPEWVSIDIRMIDQVSMEGVSFIGDIWHECNPEPATMSVLALGSLVLLRRRRRR